MQAETSVAEAVTGDDTVRSPIATAPIPGLVWAFRIHSDGSSESLAIDQPIGLAHDGLLWLHFNLADARALQWLASADLRTPAQARALLLSKDTYQQLHTTDDSVYGVISDLLRDIAEVTEETGYLRFVMTERLLVSGRHHALTSVASARLTLEQGGRRLSNVASLLELIVEHVADVELFLNSCGRMVKPGGLLFLSTLNRTAKAWALAIAGAEYILGWLPRGTHDWKKFLKPSEVVNGLRAGGIEAQEIVGVVYSPLSRALSLNKGDLDVNYMLYGSRLVR